MKIKLETQVTLDTEDVFTSLRNTYNDSQIARLAVKMGEKRYSDNIAYHAALLREVSKAIVKSMEEMPEMREADPEYTRHVEFLAGNEPDLSELL